MDWIIGILLGILSQMWVSYVMAPPLTEKEALLREQAILQEEKVNLISAGYEMGCLEESKNRKGYLTVRLDKGTDCKTLYNALMKNEKKMAAAEEKEKELIAKRKRK
jgi:Tfp pilus assembly protein PilE